LGHRGSQLALWQSRWVRDRLAEKGHDSRIEIIHTTGDKIVDVALSKVGTKGLFTKEIEEALLAGTIDLAVHSLKDMPTDLPHGLTLAATPIREDPRDALIGYGLTELPPGAKVGTSSLRRAAQLRAMRQDLNLQDIRGNVDTRLRKLDEGQYDAIVLAAAGLLRLGWADRITEYLDPGVMCPAPGQGALAIETRDDGGPGQLAARSLNDIGTHTCVVAERGVLAALGGGCQVPIGAHGRVESGTLILQALIISPDGTCIIRRETSGSVENAARMGRELGDELLAGGGRQVLETVYGTIGR